MTSYYWTAAEDDLLRAQYHAGDMATLQMKLSHRTQAAIVSRAKLLGVRRRADAMAWTPEQDAALRAGYPDGDLDELVATIGRSIHSIRDRAKKLKVRRCATVTRDLHRANAIEQAIDTSTIVPQALAVRTELERCWRCGT